MVAHIVDQFSFQDYTVLILDRDIPMHPYNVYKIDGVTYKPVPFHARPLTDKIIMNVIAIQATGDFISKKGYLYAAIIGLYLMEDDMERIKKLSNNFYSLNLYTGKTDFKPGHNIMCFFLVEHPCSEEFIKDQALQLLMTPCLSFDFYGTHSHPWEAGFCAVYHQIYPNSNAAEEIQINRWSVFDGFVDALHQALSCRPLIPCDIYLVYDDEDIYQMGIHRLKRYETINRYHPDW